MSTNHSTDAPNLATIPIVTLKDPSTGLEVQVLKPRYESALRRKQPIVITLYPEDAVPVSAAAMNEEDEVIAEIIGTSPGITKADIIRLAESEYNTILSTDSFKNRFRKDKPLHSRGYCFRDGGYHPPSV